MTQETPKVARTLTAHLVVKDPAAAIDYYKQAFGALEDCRLKMPGTEYIMHAGLRIGDSMLMLATENTENGCSSKSPISLGGTPVTVHLYTDNVDETYQKALDAGAEAIMPPTDMFWGDRYSKVRDPFGHEWSIATPIRTMTPEEIESAAAEFFRSHMQPA
jgi:PhnB protein